MRKDEGYFGTESIFWRVWRERIQLFGASRAVLLQLAHPLIAAGVGEHSNFRQNPLARLERTLNTMLTIVFADHAKANQSLHHLAHVHQLVKGTLQTAAGVFPAGTSYSANDPALKLWVHATLMDTGLLVHEKFVGPLTQSEKEQFYAESKILASLMQIPPQIVPKNLTAFNRYFTQMLENDTIVVSTQAKALANDILRPNITLVPPLFFTSINSVTKVLLPKDMQIQYKLMPTKVDSVLAKSIKTTVRAALPVMPKKLRFMPQYRNNVSDKK